MKEMAWLPKLGSDGEKVLHLRVDGGQWIPYNSSPYGVPDYMVPRGSKGWASFQALMATGEWVLVPTDKAQAVEPVNNVV